MMKSKAPEMSALKMGIHRFVFTNTHMKAVYGKICVFKLIKKIRFRATERDECVKWTRDFRMRNDEAREIKTKRFVETLAFHVGGDIKTVLECGSEYSGLHQTLVPQGKWLQVVQGERDKSTCGKELGYS